MYYNNKLDPDELVSAEEMIAAIIFDWVENDPTIEKAVALDACESCSKLGRDILLAILNKFRPDLLDIGV